MKVIHEWCRAVSWQDGGINYVDQRALPREFAVRSARTVEEVAAAISTSAIRGGGTVAVAAAYALALAAVAGIDVGVAQRLMLDSDPTNPVLKPAVDAIVTEATSPKAILEAAREFDETLVKTAEDIGFHALSLVGPWDRVLTQFGGGWLSEQDWGTALSPVYKAVEFGLRPFVYVDETRPGFEGAKIIAWELANASIDYAVVIGNASANLIQRGLANLVIVSAHRLAANGDAVCVIGTYAKALAAKEHNIGFYVAARLSAVDLSAPTGWDIPTGMRNEAEVLAVEGIDQGGGRARVGIAPPRAAAVNPGFDVTPQRLITGIITEKGIINANSESLKSTV